MIPKSISKWIEERAKKEREPHESNGCLTWADLAEKGALNAATETAGMILKDVQELVNDLDNIITLTREYVETIIEPQIKDALSSKNYELASYCEGQLHAYLHSRGLVRAALNNWNQKYGEQSDGES